MKWQLSATCYCIVINYIIIYYELYCVDIKKYYPKHMNVVYKMQKLSDKLDTMCTMKNVV